MELKFKDKLKKELELHGLSPEQLASNLDNTISGRTIRKYIDGKIKSPSKASLKLLADYFNIDITYLADDTIPNKDTTNIDIYKELKLTDVTINNIKTIVNNDEYIFAFNNLLENLNIKEISFNIYKLACYTDMFNKLAEIYNVVKLEKRIYDLLKIKNYEEINILLTVFNKLFKDLDFYVLPSKLKKDNYIYEGNDAFKDSSLINIETIYKDLVKLFNDGKYEEFRDNYYKVVKAIKDYRMELFYRIKSIKYEIMEEVLNAVNMIATNIYEEDVYKAKHVPGLEKYYNNETKKINKDKLKK